MKDPYEMLNDLKIDENEYIDTYLTKHYKVIATVENAEILQRL